MTVEEQDNVLWILVLTYRQMADLSIGFSAVQDRLLVAIMEGMRSSVTG